MVYFMKLMISIQRVSEPDILIVIMDLQMVRKQLEYYFQMNN